MSNNILPHRSGSRNTGTAYSEPQQPLRWGFDYIHIPDPEPPVCARFGCGHHLTLPERLAGRFCSVHMAQGQVGRDDINEDYG